MTAATAVPDGSEAAGRLNHDFSVIALLQNFTTGRARIGPAAGPPSRFHPVAMRRER